MLKLLRVIGLPCCLLTMGGCESGKQSAELTAPVVVDVAPIRCPDADPALRREFRRVTMAPVADTTGTDGKPAVSLGTMKAKLDEMRLSEARKNKAGTRALSEYDACRNGAAKTS